MAIFGKEDGNRVQELLERSDDMTMDELENALLRLDAKTLKGPELRDRYYWLGVVAFQQGNRPEAFERFAEAHAHFPEDTAIGFSLGQEHEFRGQVAEAWALFDANVDGRLPPGLAMGQARYAYLWDEWDRAKRYLAPTWEQYAKLGIADTTFLSMRGMPPLEECWAFLGALHELTDDWEAFRTLTRDAVQGLKEHDFTEMVLLTNAVTGGDTTRLLQLWKGQVVQARREGWPTGATALKSAIVLAAAAGDAGTAGAYLEAVEITDADWPWLEDMRLLAWAEMAGRFAPESEAGLQASFLERQPYLFEPHLAFQFRLTRYQEGLKPLYRRSRGS